MEVANFSAILAASENIGDEGQHACYMYSSFQLCKLLASSIYLHA